MNARIGLALTTVFLSSWASAQPSASDLVHSSRCRAEIEAQIAPKILSKKWQSIKVESKADLPHTLYSYADLKIGKRFELWQDSEKFVLQIVDFNADKFTRQVWPLKASCSKSSSGVNSLQHDLVTDSPQFTDHDLINLVKSKPWGVIYVWSTRMPLAMKGIDEVSKAVTQAGGSLTVLLDPNVSQNEGAAAIVKNQLHTGTPISVASEELFRRGVGLHYPTALFFSNGVLSPRIYNGYKPADAYAKWISLETKLLKEENSK